MVPGPRGGAAHAGGPSIFFPSPPGTKCSVTGARYLAVDFNGVQAVDFNRLLISTALRALISTDVLLIR